MKIVIETNSNIHSVGCIQHVGYSNAAGLCGHQFTGRNGVVVSIGGTPEECESLAEQLLRDAKAAREGRVTMNGAVR